MDDFEQQLKLDFLQEASQGLDDVENCFLQLESQPDDVSLLEKIFRVAHNIKGSGRAVGFEELGSFTHEYESLMLKLKTRQLPVNTDTIGLMLRCNDHVRQMVEALKGDFAASLDSSALLTELKAAMNGSFATSAPAAPSENSVSTVDQVLENSTTQDVPPADAFGDNGFESMAAMGATTEAVVETASTPDATLPATPTTPMLATDTKLTIVEATTLAPTLAASLAESLAQPPAPTAAPPPQAHGSKASSAADETIRVSIGRLEKLLNLVGEMVLFETILNEQSNQVNHPMIRKTVHQLSKVTHEIQDLSMSLRMVPIKPTFQKMQRIVRDTAGTLHKKISFEIEGEETELDKTVLENLSDPLVHLIRNAVDHGIEMPEERLAKGKPEAGTVKLAAYQQSGRLIIEIKDDGNGIDGPRLLEKAIQKGVLKPGTQMSLKDSIHLIFHPGFSTKAQVSEVSGRGVGMDVVKTNIESLHGEVIVDTVVGKGTTFKIVLPLTLAIIDAMIVKSGGERYVIPLSHVHETVRMSGDDIHARAGVGELMLLRGETLPIYRLGHLLGAKKIAADGIALVIRTQSDPFVILVDDILGQYQVVSKKLGAELAHVKGYAGSAILGDGRPSLILELADLLSRAANTTARPIGPIAQQRSA